MQTRRGFVKTSALVIGASAASVGLMPAPAKTVMATHRCATNAPKAGKTLVAYASRHGSTAEIAVAIAKQLCKDGQSADARWIGDLDNIHAYDAVIIGSAIRYDKWLPEATAFVQTHQSTLSNMPTALFFCCLAASSPTEAAARQTQKYAQKIATQLPNVTPDQVGQFAGVLNYSKLPRLARLPARALFAYLGADEGDYRNWAAIRSWTETTPHSRLNRLI